MNRHLIYIIVTTALTLSLNACQVLSPQYDYQALAKASIRLGMDIDYNDKHTLYLYAAEWIGVPYHNGGESFQGIDCSGLAKNIHRKIYGKHLSRTVKNQLEDGRKIYRQHLKAGDLVFFTSPSSPQKAAHVGIYLKDNKFIHASTTKGVIVSSLEEEYYNNHYLCATRID